MNEQRLWEETAKANAIGMKFDRELVLALRDIRDAVTETKGAQLKNMTGMKHTQTEALRLWLKTRDLHLDNLQAGTIDTALAGDPPSEEVREVLMIRRELAQVSSSKLDAMMRYGGESERLHDMLVYYGASTGRWSGRGPQPQNYSRGSFKVNEDVDPDIFKQISWDHIELLYGCDAMAGVATMLRPCLMADEGMHLFDADYSAIEAVTLAWLADEEKLLEQFRGDGKVYEAMASEVFGVPLAQVDEDQRFVGKQAILGCGYQAAGERFHDMCLSYGRDIGLELAESTVHTYRETYSKIPALWKSVQEGIKAAIRSKGRVVPLDPHSRVLAQSTGRFLHLRLPSGRAVTYAMPRIEMVEKVFREGEEPKEVEQIVYTGMNSQTRRWSNISTYGGSLTETIVQATARDLMANGMFRTIDAGYQYLLTVHDQIVSQREKGKGSLEEYVSLMCDLPSWAEGIPLKAEGKVAQRFSK